jgi:D-alanyl-lipoteichoic acid acyltransferase DltB (MBOAT superfamily)
VTISLLSAEFLSFSFIAVVLIVVLRGLTRQVAFLAANLGFVWMLLGTEGTLSTAGFCVIGYVLVWAHVRWPRLRLLYTLPLLLALFAYMRNYEFLQWVLPDQILTNFLRTVGLSFILFRMIHVIVDARSRTLGPIDFLTYMNYCLSFTTLMMGPIQRYRDFSDQWHGHRQAIDLTFEAHFDAVLRILLGLVKAHILAPWVESFALAANTNVLDLSPVGWIVGLYGFYFFLYLSFSGYCDVVIGLGSLFGVRPPENFNMPFVAQNISDFWLRQHRSLTLWLTDYVFSPAYKAMLSGRTLSDRPLLAGALALLLTMLVSGLWHGTTIGFLLFGLAHGLFLMIYHVWDHLLVGRLGRKRVAALRRAWPARAAGTFLTFNAAAFAFLFFRLDTPHLFLLFEALFGV